MRILVIGRSGQMARALAERAETHPQLMMQFVSRADLDLTDDSAIAPFVESRKPAIIVNLAGYTAVDQAEDDVRAAWRVNADAPGILAEAARATGARLIHLSTDYVYDGSGDQPIVETARVSPVNHYGRSKLAGEVRIRETLSDHIILRTAWIYGPFGLNFVRAVLRKAEKQDQLEVVDDQIGSPTSSLDAADALLAIVSRWEREPRLGLGDTFHLAGRGFASWADLAKEVFVASRELGGPVASVVGVPSTSRPTRAERPRNSCLDTTKFSSAFEHETPCWKASLGRDVARILADG